MGSREDREPHDVHIFLHRRTCDHVGSLVQAGVNHLHPGIPKRGGHDLCTPVVPVQPGLGYEHPNRTSKVARLANSIWRCHSESRLAKAQQRGQAVHPSGCFGIIHHIHVDTLPQRVLDCLVYDVDDRNRVAFAV